MDPCFETATRLARAIRNGRLSSVEATKMHLERITRTNGPINALVVVDGDGAMKAARAADRALARNKAGRKKAELGPLNGFYGGGSVYGGGTNGIIPITGSAFGGFAIP